MVMGGAQIVVGAAPSAPVASSATGTQAYAISPAGISDARRQQLLQGAAPATALEQQWTAQVEPVLRGYVQLLQAIAAEHARQAALGRDLYGRVRAEDHAFEQRVLELVNQQRSMNGLGAVTYDSRLDQASEQHNAQQAATRSMAHSGIGDGDPGSRIRATGFANAWGENVATGQLSPEQVVAEWMASPGHRRNILDPNFRLMGVSYGTGADGRTYWAQSFGA